MYGANVVIQVVLCLESLIAHTGAIRNIASKFSIVLMVTSEQVLIKVELLCERPVTYAGTAEYLA